MERDSERADAGVRLANQQHVLVDQWGRTKS